MKQFIPILYIFLVLTSCENKKKYNRQKESKQEIKLKQEPVLADEVPIDSSIYFNNELDGDTLLYYKYQRLAPKNKIIFDTLDYNPLSKLKIITSIPFETSITACYKGKECTYAYILTSNKQLKMEFINHFIDNQNQAEEGLITLVNGKLFSVKKLLGEMFYKESDIYFHYDGGEIYKLSDGNLLYVEQPGSWCGLANQFDCFQYFDLKKKEIIQFVEKDEFINALK